MILRSGQYDTVPSVTGPALKNLGDAQGKTTNFAPNFAPKSPQFPEPASTCAPS